MDWINVIVMAVGLAMDCCAVSTVQGLTHRQWHPRALLMAAIFGCFHMGMPIIGYYAGTFFVNFMQTYAPWIALTLLGFLGVKMIWESYHKDEESEKCANWKVTNLLFLAIATSVDVCCYNRRHHGPLLPRWLPARRLCWETETEHGVGRWTRADRFGN